jgi:hypothetical protein
MLERTFHCLLDRIGRRHEWFTTFELVNRCALFAQRHDAVAQLDDIGKADLCESRSQP